MSALRGRALRRDLEREGWTFTRLRSGHYRGTHPALRPGEFLLLPSTPGGGRGEANVRAMARRMIRSAGVG